MSNSGMTTIEVKHINRKKVYELIYNERAVSKQEISRKLNMGLTTVTQNLKALEEDGLITRTGFYESTGGRKAQAIEIIKNAKTAIGAFILKNKIILATVDLYGNVIKQTDISRSFSADSDYISFFGNAVTEFAACVEPDSSKISGVGIAIQGIIANDGERVSYGKLLERTDITLERLAENIPYKCRLLHDSKAAALAEIWGLPQINDAIVFLLNKNLGSALVLNREIHRGKSVRSGTVEHMITVPNGKPCYCGGKGCLEAYCSAEALQKAAGGLAFDSFFHMLRGGNADCAAVWDEYLNFLALAICNCCTIVDDDIILSGFLAAYINRDDIAILSEKIHAVPFFAERNIEIFLGKYGEKAAAIGAALPFVKQTVLEV